MSWLLLRVLAWVSVRVSGEDCLIPLKLEGGENGREHTLGRGQSEHFLDTKDWKRRETNDRSQDIPTSCCGDLDRKKRDGSVRSSHNNNEDLATGGSSRNGRGGGDRDAQMAHLRGGVFTMGTNPSDGFVFEEDGEGPARRVEVSPFAIGKYAVSNAEFEHFVSETGYVTEAEKFGWSFAGSWKLCLLLFHDLLDFSQNRTTRRRKASCTVSIPQN